MVCFSIKEILRATGGNLISGQGTDTNVMLKGVSTDSRIICQEKIFIALKGQNFDGHNFISDAIKKSVKCIIVSDSKQIPKIYRNIFVIKVSNTTNAIAQLAQLHRKRFNIYAIGITGSNGKTTTKALLAHILSKKFPTIANVGTENNILGLSKTLFCLTKRQKIIVAELGTNHEGEIESLAKILQPNIAVITNIGSAHIGNFGIKNKIFKEKISLIKHLSGRSAGFLNGDDKYLQRVKKNNIHFYGIGNYNEIRAEDIRFTIDGSRFKIKNGTSYISFQTKMLGLHNIYNVLAAIAVARFLKIDYTTIKKTIKTFKPPYGRLNIKKIKGVTFFDDTYNANPDSLASGLEAVSAVLRKKSAKRIFILGDMLELGKFTKKYHQDVADLAKKYSFDYLLTFGKYAKFAIKQLKKIKSKNIFGRHFGTHSEILEFISKILKKGDFVFIKGSRKMKMEEIIKCFTNFSMN